VNLASIDAVAKLETLRAAEGFETVDEMLEAATFDSVSPAICFDCDHTCEMEPDQDRGYCENCGQNTVVSALILAGII
jgi:hypothetical protein